MTSRTVFISAISLVFLLSACAGEASETTQESDSLPAAVQDAEAAVTLESEGLDSEPPNPSPTAAPFAPVDLLLPDEAIAAYIPSYSVRSSSVGGLEPRTFPPLSNVRPKKCLPVLQLWTSPLEDTAGELPAYAGNYVSTESPNGDLGPSFYQQIFYFNDAQEAQQRFAEVATLIGDCTSASGEWPQQGTVIINDGINRETLRIDEVNSSDPDLILLKSRDLFDDEIRDFQAIALVDDKVVWLDFAGYGDITSKRAANVFDRYVRDAVGFAETGEFDLAVTESVTLECLDVRPLPYKLIESYSRFSGPGGGEDLFVEFRLAATNNCGKEVRGFKYDVEFLDEFGDSMLSGNATVKRRIGDGETKRSDDDVGYEVKRAFDADVIKWFTEVDPADVTVNISITQVLFSDQTSLP